MKNLINKQLLIILLIGLSTATKAQDIMTTSFFTGSYQELLQEAKRLKKPIILDFTASWCGPCKKMVNETYSDELVASIVSLKYFAYKVDVQELEGLELADKYEAFQYPTTMFLDYNGKVLGRLKGFYPPEYFIKILQMNQNRRRSVFNKEEDFDSLITSL
jgi:thioredoxin 1